MLLSVIVFADYGDADDPPTLATWAELPAGLLDRYRGLVDRIAPYGAALQSGTNRDRCAEPSCRVRHRPAIAGTG